ncbi:MAG: protein translocase subunit SecF [Clostridiales bacterium]|nr:protein translocase subunit SecF [Clostridiales bacterium]
MRERFDIVKRLNIFALISVVLCLVGIVSLVLLPFKMNFFNLDIDFVGGTTLHYNMHISLDKPQLDKIGSIVEGVIGEPASSVQKAGDGSEVIIKTKTIDTETRGKVFEALKAEYNLNAGEEATADKPAVKSDILSVDNVDPVVGTDLRNAAITASFLAIVLMLLYISIRFDFKSGLAAVIALIHDILIMISAYVIFRVPLNMTFIAAALTILGYSINATIVIFDRVRENRRLMRKATFDEIVNTSIWQTMQRSLNTTLTTLLPLIMLLILGVDSVRNFALPLTVGIIAGLYSSVFISGPIWAAISRKAKKA